MKIKLNWLLFFCLVIITWQLTVSLLGTSENLFPGPLTVFSALVVLALNGELFVQIAASFWRLLAGLAIGSLAGVLVGLIMGRNNFLDETVSPFLHILRSFPPVAIIPLIIIWFGITDSSKVFSIALAVFFPVWVSTLLGAKRIHQDHIRAAKLLTNSKSRRFFEVIFPATLPQVITGIRIGIGMAFIMVFVSELSGASVGLGYFIANAQITYRIDNLIAGLIVLGLLAAATDALFVFIVNKLFPWVGKNEQISISA